jgi:hypothetical protein
LIEKAAGGDPAAARLLNERIEKSGEFGFFLLSFPALLAFAALGEFGFFLLVLVAFLALVGVGEFGVFLLSFPVLLAFSALGEFGFFLLNVLDGIGEGEWADDQ